MPTVVLALGAIVLVVALLAVPMIMMIVPMVMVAVVTMTMVVLRVMVMAMELMTTKVMTLAEKKQFYLCRLAAPPQCSTLAGALRFSKHAFARLATASARPVSMG